MWQFNLFFFFNLLQLHAKWKLKAFQFLIGGLMKLNEWKTNVWWKKISFLESVRSMFCKNLIFLDYLVSMWQFYKDTLNLLKSFPTYQPKTIYLPNKSHSSLKEWVEVKKVTLFSSGKDHSSWNSLGSFMFSRKIEWVNNWPVSFCSWV